MHVLTYPYMFYYAINNAICKINNNVMRYWNKNGLYQDSKYVNDRYDNLLSMLKKYNFNVDKKRILLVGEGNSCMEHLFLCNDNIKSVQQIDKFYNGMDICNISMKNKFDVIYSNSVIEHIYNPTKAILNMIDMLSVHGIIICGIDFSNHNMFTFLNRDEYKKLLTKYQHYIIKYNGKFNGIEYNDVLTILNFAQLVEGIQFKIIKRSNESYIFIISKMHELD